MGLYTLSFDLAGVFTGTLPKLVVKYGGYKIGMAYASEDGTSVSLVIDTGDKAFVSSDLIFGFVKDGVSDPSRQILVSNIRIDGEAVNTSGFSAQYGNPDITTDHLALGTGDTATSNVHGHIPETPAEYTPSTDPSPVTYATIDGDAGNNRLYGTVNADTINGNDGNDKILAYDGNDVVNGGTGADYIDGGLGADTLNGDAGNDVIYGGDGNDTIHGGADDDRLFGQIGDDYIYGDDGNDYIHGNEGADHLYGGLGNDKIGGDAGNDVIYGGDGNDQLFGDEGDDELHGEAGDDRMIGNDGNDTMYGDDGNDNMDGQYGNDIMYGGIGIDTVDGEWGDDTIDGGDGNDFLIGGLGSDVVDGGTGDDIIHGGGISSWDQYDIRVNSSWGASGLWFNEQTQSFYRYVSAGTNYAGALAAAQGAMLNGVAGHLVNVTSSAENSWIQGFISGDVRMGLTDENVEGRWEYTAGAEDGAVAWENGSVLPGYYQNWNAGEPNDYGAGEDHSELQTNSTWNDEGDNVSLGYIIEWNAEEIQVDTNTNTLNGGLGNDQIYGDGGIDIMHGNEDNDQLYGLGGNDQMFGDDGHDTLVGGAGNDQMDGGTGNDRLYGGDGNDTLQGGMGIDRLEGDAGNDTLQGDAVAAVIGEAGHIYNYSQADSVTWMSVSFGETIINPVVKMTFNTFNNADPATLRVRNVTNTGFEFQIDEWDYLDGAHGAEDISWLAVASGRHTLDNGLTIEAGTTTATNENLSTVNFSSSFGSTPYVFSQVMSYNESDAVTTRQQNIGTGSFRVKMLEEENHSNSHATETIGWIAMDSGGSVGQGLVNGQVTNVSEATSNINFGGTFLTNSPVVIMEMQTTNGGDTAVTRGATNVSSSGADVFISEEQSRDSEMNHGGLENVAWLALNDGLLYENGTGGNDTLYGGSGLDTLYGGEGADTFVFEAASAFANTDQILDFRYQQGDVLDLSDIIGGIGGNPITDYVQFVSSGNDTLIQIDANGATGGANFVTAGQLSDLQGLDVSALYSNGNIVV